jgi:hypothetical protein
MSTTIKVRPVVRTRPEVKIKKRTQHPLTDRVVGVKVWKELGEEFDKRVRAVSEFEGERVSVGDVGRFLLEYALVNMPIEYRGETQPPTEEETETPEVPE